MTYTRPLGPIAAMCLLLAACAKTQGDADVKPVASVTTAVVATGPAVRTVTAYGAAEFSPGGERSLTAPVEANLERIVAPAGSRVAAGQVVALLRPTPTTALELGRAKTDAATADAARARAQRLRAAGLASDADLEAATAAARIADAGAASLSGRSGGALALRAPRAGVVESVAVPVGAVAAQGAEVARIGDLSGIRIKLGLDPGLAAKLRAGLMVRLTALSGGSPKEGVVQSVDPRLDAQTRLAAVYVRATAPDLAPGEPVEGRIVLGERPGAILIPRAALVYEGERPHVFVARGGAAHRRDVNLGAEAGDLTEVASGLAPGERVVVDGASALEDGMAIREVAPAGPQAGEGP